MQKGRFYPQILPRGIGRVMGWNHRLGKRGLLHGNYQYLGDYFFYTTDFVSAVLDLPHCKVTYGPTTTGLPAGFSARFEYDFPQGDPHDWGTFIVQDGIGGESRTTFGIDGPYPADGTSSLNNQTGSNTHTGNFDAADDGAYWYLLYATYYDA